MMEPDADAVDTLFAEAFALLEESPSSPLLLSLPFAPSLTSMCVTDVVAPATTRKRTRLTTKPETSATKLKRSIHALQVEQRQLTNQLDHLRGDVAPHVHTLREQAMAAQLARRRAEHECETLRAAVYAQTQFLRGLRGLFSGDCHATLSVNLCHHLHNYTRLPKDPSLRQLEYAALRREQRVHTAIALLLRETDAIPLSKDYIDATFVHTTDEPCAITSTSVLVMDDYDVPTVLRAACVAVRDIIVRCRSYQWVGVADEIVDADSLSQSELQYRVTCIQRRAADPSLQVEPFSVASRALTMYRMVDDAAVVLWDFVDHDELHALDEPPDITRQSVGASLIRREVCSDGVERTVYRELSTRRYKHHGTWPPSPNVARYLASQQPAMQWNELLFREIMLEQIAEEQRIATAVCGQ